MIHVDRSRVARPRVLEVVPESPAFSERIEAAKFFAQSEKVRGQKRFHFRVYRDSTVIDALMELFHGKCAYCESSIAATHRTGLDHFRPKSYVTDREGHPGYWWLGSTWENIVSACGACNASKAARFPLADESKRAVAPPEEEREHPLLLNPCFDHPEAHLVFKEDGTVVSSTPEGQTTIAILGLNRPGLVEARRSAAIEFGIFLEQSASVIRDPRSHDSIRQLFLNDVRNMTAAEREFAGMKRQFAQRVIEKIFGKKAFEEIASSWDATTPTITPAVRREAQKSQQEFEKHQSDFSLANPKGREKFRMQRRQIEHISIRNFKGIESLELDLQPRSDRTGWLMLLGENGAGKSSVLQAIALTLAGAKYFRDLVQRRDLKLPEFVRSGASHAEISIKLSGFIGPHELTLSSRGKATFRKPLGDVAEVTVQKKTTKIHTKGSAAETQSVLLAYGATRLLPRRKSSGYGIQFARVDNLFDPFLPLFDADEWLRRLKDADFNNVAIVLKDLLALDNDAELFRDKRTVMVRCPGIKVPIRQLSDGYQATVAMSVDILEVATRLWPTALQAEGIVLLDEIGSHLHPTWKMRIVESLRRAFPGMQFIATTHDPLCLRGLAEGEVVVMRRDEAGRVEAVAELPSPADFRVDQLLTSEFFGLNTTSDLEAEKIFDEYYALLALPTPSPEQKLRIEMLHGQLKDRRYLGHTQREQLMYDAIDQILAKQKHGERKPIPQLKRDVVEELSRIWNEGA
ncbi:MAG TPA: AAA family ATPase [Candidatus Solibacter sp.]|nr:AAA family ATPase [Candidatus Solibacter sp.]